VEWGEVNVNRVLRDTVGLIEHQLAKARVTVAWQLDESVGPMRGNHGKLQQVFLNLFLNARDAMEAEGRAGVLTIRSSWDGELIHVEVADTGSGIPAENLSRIFDPFFTTKAPKKGTGLGLSVTYGIVQEHGGEISVESTAGAGTRFRIDFPAIRRAVAV
jgi:signal transduction histidine kinase